MAGYGYNFGDSGSSQGGSSSYGNSSFSGSSSQSSGSSQSGYSYTPQQQAWLNALYPQLMTKYAGAQQPQLNQAIGGQDVVTPGPIWNEQQIQNRVNQGGATSDQSLATQQRVLSGTLAGRGFGANSPLYQSLATNMGMQNLAQKQGNENALRWNAAQGNAEHLLKGQTALAQEDVARKELANQVYNTQMQGYTAQQNALLQALYGFNQPRPFSSSKQSSQANSLSLSSGGGGSNNYGGGYSSSGGENFSY